MKDNLMLKLYFLKLSFLHIVINMLKENIGIKLISKVIVLAEEEIIKIK